MLVLSRKPGQTIRIGDVVIQVVAIRGLSVRIGVEAPRDVPIVRGELAPIVEAENTTEGRDART